MDFGLNSRHSAELVDVLRLNRYERGQYVQSVRNSFREMTETKLDEENTFSNHEVREMIDSLQVMIISDIESELIHISHTNSLLLRQLFSQAEKWHLELQLDTSEMENRSLLDEIKQLEDKQFTIGASNIISPPYSKIKLAPINEKGGVNILENKLKIFETENENLKLKVKTIENSAIAALEEKNKLKTELEIANKNLDTLKKQPHFEILPRKPAGNDDYDDDYDDATKLELSNVNRELTESKHEILKLRHELKETAEELDRKFQDSLQFKNLKKMLLTKNEQIKELRTNLDNLQKAKE